MIDQGCKEFYGVLRGKPALMAELMLIDNRQDLNKAVIEMGKLEGFILDPVAVRMTTKEDFLDLLQSPANNDELTDDELELIAAGLPVPCGDT